MQPLKVGKQLSNLFQKKDFLLGILINKFQEIMLPP